MAEKSRKASLKVMLTGLVVVALLLVGGIVTLVGVINLRKGMEEEVQTGVAATCSSYAMVLNYTKDSSEADDLESQMHEQTGYDYTYFEGDTRVRSSIEGVVGTKAGDAIIEHVLKGNESYQAKDVVINAFFFRKTRMNLIFLPMIMWWMRWISLQQRLKLLCVQKRQMFRLSVVWGRK